jgi:hypothetical protein
MGALIYTQLPLALTLDLNSFPNPYQELRTIHGVINITFVVCFH